MSAESDASVLPDAATVMAEPASIDDAIVAARLAAAAHPDRSGPAIRLAALLCADERWAEAWEVWPHAMAADAAALDAWLPDTPRWDGTPLAGRTLGLWPPPFAWGHGDWLLWARWLPKLPRDGRVLIVAPPQLARLVEHTAPGSRCVRPQDAAGADLRCLVAGLPLLCPPAESLPSTALRAANDGAPLRSPMSSTVPLPPPYVAAHPDDVERWRGRLGPPDGRLRVGLCWQPGSVDPDLPRRGIDARLLAPLLEVPGVRWIGLQVGEHARDTTPRRLGVEPVGPRLADYADTAAVVSLLDLTISVDTSVSNLCGALGAPCWVLLPTGHDPRWGRGETATAWYPSCLLFRQRSPGAWAPVIAEVAEALRELAAGRR